ncbi:hypothetical protein SEVCU116_1800 [Staphylococcus capitis VCU116]|nr:hypothetical protein SEVCU116_1800 [Staphylococcus capitis VCU116]
MASVVPLTDDIYNLGNLAGMHFQKVFNDNVNTEKRTQFTSCGGDRVNVREETVTVNATVKIKCKFPVWLNKYTTVEDEKEKLLDVIAENPEKELMNENFEFVDLIEVD